MDHFLFFLGILTVNNFVLSRHLALEMFFFGKFNIRDLFLFSFYLLVLLFVSSVLNYLIYVYLLIPLDLIFLDTFAFVLVILFLILPLIRKLFSWVFYKDDFLIDNLVFQLNYLALAVSQFNVVYVRDFDSFDLIFAILNGFGNALAIFFTMIFVFFIQKRLELLRIPDFLRGVPITFLILAFISMGIRIFDYLISFFRL